MDLERQKENFKDHKATFTDFGNIKILDFKNPNSSHYRIRFLFEEDFYRLYISGDLGELIAANYYNMCWDKFEDFVDDIGYFHGKIICHNRPIFTYDYETAREDVMDYIEDYDLYDEIIDNQDEFMPEEDQYEDFLNDVFNDFTEDKGMKRIVFGTDQKRTIFLCDKCYHDFLQEMIRRELKGMRVEICRK